jgi:hypothetical protein
MEPSSILSIRGKIDRTLIYTQHQGRDRWNLSSFLSSMRGIDGTLIYPLSLTSREGRRNPSPLLSIRGWINKTPNLSSAVG